MNHPVKIGQPRFLAREEVLSLHRASIDTYGGSDGILDDGKLESALAMPRQGFGSEYHTTSPLGWPPPTALHRNESSIP